MTQALTDALRKLEPGNDNHWTADGLPRLDTVKMFAGNPGLNREAVDAAAPGFTRANAAEYKWESAAETPPVPPPAPPVPPAPPAPPAPPEPQVQDTDPTPPADTPEVDASNFPQAGAEPAKVEEFGSADSDEIAQMEAALAKANEVEADMLGGLDLIQKNLAHLRQGRDDLQRELDKARPPRTNTDDIQDYLASQKRALAERAARKQLIKDSGLDLKELARDLKAPIDAAMARKNSRGTARPTKA